MTKQQFERASVLSDERRFLECRISQIKNFMDDGIFRDISQEAKDRFTSEATVEMRAKVASLQAEFDAL